MAELSTAAVVRMNMLVGVLVGRSGGVVPSFASRPSRRRYPLISRALSLAMTVLLRLSNFRPFASHSWAGAHVDRRCPLSSLRGGEPVSVSVSVLVVVGVGGNCG